MAPYIASQSYPSYQQPSSIPDPAEQNQVLTQTWLWVPHMKCSLHNDPSFGAIYLIREVTWDGYAKTFRLQQLTSNNHSHNSKQRDAYREVSEAELKAPTSALVDDMAIGSMGMSMTGQLTSPAGAGGRSRRESVGSAGRLLGISLTCDGAGARYRSVGAGSIGGGGLDAALYQQQQQQQQLGGLHHSQLPHSHPQQYGNVGYQNGSAFGGGSRHWQSNNFDNGFPDDERDGGSSGSGSGSGSGRDRRQDRDMGRDRDRDSDRRSHGKEKGRSSKASGSGGGKQRGDKDRDRKGSMSPAGRSEGGGSGRR